ncbi:polymerase [Sweetwater Branch virus]|uniref:Replicase n=1 Tax=Sweetwater Branch virus TaxID=1272958 RepID=A0A0D3R154_9RHAB|nr:polymerase [Sweetwater Branch virus]AJR28388.1 polymerase [Sweetwater Branch virus]
MDDLDSTDWEYEIGWDEADSLEYEDLESVTDQYCELTLLNLHDYNLNSPIIPDKIDTLIKYLNGLPYEEIFFTPDFEFVQEALKLNKIVNLQDLPSFDQIIKIWPQLISSRTKTHEEGRAVLEETFKDLTQMYEVIRAFYKGWLNQDPPQDVGTVIESIEKIPYDEIYMFGTFLDLFFITNLINARTIMEQKNICLKKKWKANLINKRLIFFSGNAGSFGPFILSREYLYLIDYHMILDRNMILMIKDTLVGRFQTIFSMRTLQTEYKFTEIEILELKKLYELGDNILMSNGKEGYDIIKTLEMICNDWLCTESFKYYRPMPDFINFRNHVLQTIEDLSVNISPIAKQWYQHVHDCNNIHLILVYYGSFRHWGHPPIEVLRGLEALENLVNEDHIIDDDYCQALASDLAYKVLKKKFKEDKKWYVDASIVPADNLLHDHIKNNTWPNSNTRVQFGDNWHRLPLVKCFDLPDMIDISSIYSDKSHSIQKQEIIQHIQLYPYRPIPTKRVLNTLLEKESVNWPEFLSQIDKDGLPDDDLVIGLKPKERELKRTGRFFSLMSWNLRNYFVITELLIKEHFLGLFNGLTMADDLQNLIKKLLDRTSGQGDSVFKKINIANGLDYTKWNNYQRKNSNKYVFRVMGQFLGYPSLIEKTHEFFETSLIYYPSRPDLMMINNGIVTNKTQQIVCWNGQLGGLEGLRQKGWSVLNYLMIERESKIRNSQVKILAQGDNQIIFTSCFLDPYYSEDELLDHMLRARRNNDAIMDAVLSGAGKIGLVINMDETMQSCCYANYGKLVLFRGKILGLPTKRWSRVTCSSNDQIPSLGTLLASVSTNSMTVGNFSETPHDAILGHLLFGLITLEILFKHNPAIRGSPESYIKQHELMNHYLFKILLLYLDPSLGGIGGTSLNRFIIRAFPDPVTESLSFWKIIGENTNDPHLQKLAISAGSPLLASYREDHFQKLVEKPESLNIPKGISSTNMIKEQIKSSLINNAHNIRNKILRDVTIRIRDEEPSLFAWLRSIKPVFPRFLSEMASSTFYGLSENLISLFTNSRTIRNCFRSKCVKEVDYLIIKSEIIGIVSNIKLVIRALTNSDGAMWECSATRADELRKRSWGCDIVGMTVPHPIEMHSVASAVGGECGLCFYDELSSNYISVLTPKGIPQTDYNGPNGPYKPYLGSSTNEGTSILQPWEKETKIPTIKRAARLRDVISWFVEDGSNLGISILNNLESLTGENWGNFLRGFKRTGSALHRFRCARISNGGYSACNPTKSTWMIVTTDTLSHLNEANYDFMFQASIIYSQVSVSSTLYRFNQVHHVHIDCHQCLRPIEEPVLESDWVYKPKDVSELLKSWRPDPLSPWGCTKKLCVIHNNNQDWEYEKPDHKCFFIGFVLGFCFGDQVLSGVQAIDSSLFPLSIRSKLNPDYFYGGLLKGLKCISSLHLTHRRNILNGRETRVILYGTLYYLIEELSCNSDFIQFVSVGHLHNELLLSPHKIPPSYPLSGKDLGSLVRSYLKFKIKENDLDQQLDYLWIFADIRTPKLICSFGISIYTDTLLSKQQLTKKDKENLKVYQNDYILANNDELPEISMTYYLRKLKFCESELRHSCKFTIMSPADALQRTTIVWGSEASGSVSIVHGEYQVNQSGVKVDLVPQLRNPIISGLRLFQCATGAHYKIRSILKNYSLQFKDVIVGGDGSGGITSLCLRLNRTSKAIFNSLMILEDTVLNGSRPSGPSAVASLGADRCRCVNYETAWQEPNDLRSYETWEYFAKLVHKHNLKVNLMIFDMEVTDQESIRSIDEHLIQNLRSLYSQKSSYLIYKTYTNRILNQDPIILKIGQNFKNVDFVTTEFSSFHTSEIYVVAHNLEDMPILSRGWLSDSTLIQVKNLSYASQTVSSEVQRAFKIRARPDLLNGVPIHLMTDPFLDLSTLMVMSGVMSSDACKILQTGSNHINVLNLIISESVIAMNNIFELTSIKPKGVKIPSNPELNTLFSLILGIGLWTSLICKDEDQIRLLDAIINKHVYTEVTITARKVTKGYLGSWSIMNRFQDRVVCQKKYHVSQKLAMIGQVIRCCELCYRNKKCKDTYLSEKELDDTLKSRNKKLRLKYILEMSDLLFFYSPHIFHST